MTCAIRGNNDIKGIKLPGEPGGKELEAKISITPIQLYRMLFVDLRKLLCLLHFVRLRIV
jgi:hypothetical protein